MDRALASQVTVTTGVLCAIALLSFLVRDTPNRTNSGGDRVCFFEPVLSYILNPGKRSHVQGAVAVTSRITLLF